MSQVLDSVLVLSVLGSYAKVNCVILVQGNLVRFQHDCGIGRLHHPRNSGNGTWQGAFRRFHLEKLFRAVKIIKPKRNGDGLKEEAKDLLKRVQDVESLEV